MHDAAYEWVAQHAIGGSVLEIGGRDINGSVRCLFGSEYTSIDLVDGPGVDVVADVTEYEPRDEFDVVVCCEVLEHTEADIIGAAHRLLRKGGTLIFTAAGPGRAPHSAVDGGLLRQWEVYRNIDRDFLVAKLLGFSTFTIDVAGDDIRAVAVK